MGKDFICRSDYPIVETTAGKIRGYKLGDVFRFYGIQYAVAKRWQQPEKVKPWDGVKDALNFGCTTYPLVEESIDSDMLCPLRFWQHSEDCLNLNVWTKSIEKGVKKPVMVWIHGGGFATCSATITPVFDGDALCEYGDVVYVSVNHRLNIWGFLDVSDRGEQYANSGNCGIADLVAALQWIHDNIDAFGGDPDNVTIFGQSGGGGKCMALLQVPAADGLFHKAIIQSGCRSAEERDVSKEFSDKLVEKLLKKLGTDDFSVLENLPPRKVMDLLDELGDEVSMRRWGPVPNGWYVGHAMAAGFTENSKKVKMMLGSNINEMGLKGPDDKYTFTEEERLAYVKAAFPENNTAEYIELFKKTWPDKNIIDAAFIDDSLRAATVAFCDYRAKENCADTYNYLFSLEFPFFGGKSAWHCAELPFVFHNKDMCPIDGMGRIADLTEDRICSAWVNFAHTGDPNNRFLPEWPKWKEGAGATMVIDVDCEARIDFDRELIAARKAMKYVPVKKAK